MMFSKLTEKLMTIVYSCGNRQLNQFFHNVSFKPVTLIQGVGTDYYQKRASWKLSELCPCDQELVEYLQQHGIEGKTIFHFGTGEHHLLGLENNQFNHPNTIFAITASIAEHQMYIHLCQQNRHLSKFYKVLWGDIYTLTANLLPPLDLVTLFHVGEFYMPEDAPFLHQNDTSLVELFLKRLNPEGKLLFYTNSLGWKVTEPILQSLESQQKIYQSAEYKSLRVYALGKQRSTGLTE